ncbi:probable palmitoyltransferase ZDHHC24 [Cydia strobilella]|uniref:probable palmitoyltransferase ZDHHC24 n=1 Tax=Cydia strobilella TaxID=1100964 RepID=UPI00300403E5
MLIQLESITNKPIKRVLEHVFYLLLILILIPVFVYFELCIVLPAVEKDKSKHAIHLCIAFFLLLNIVGNMIYGMLTDSSIKGKMLDSKQTHDWSFCSVCECLRPPRAWHCNICNICILKRDHHCTYLTSCVGYFNYRYFILLTLYIFIAMVYAFYYNLKFLATFISWNHGLAIIRFIFPLANFAVDASFESVYIFIVVINFIVSLFTGFLAYYHFSNVFKGQTTPERKYNECNYNKGWRRNLIEVFGVRWYLTWILPFIQSPLPGDGIQWHYENKYK